MALCKASVVYFTSRHDVKNTFQKESRRAVRSFIEVHSHKYFRLGREFERYFMIELKIFFGSLPVKTRSGTVKLLKRMRK